MNPPLPVKDLTERHNQEIATFARHYAPLQAIKEMTTREIGKEPGTVIVKSTGRSAFEGFLFHDLQNMFANNAYLECINDLCLSVEQKNPRVMGIIKQLGTKIKDKERRMLNKHEYLAGMNEIAQFALLPQIQSIISQDPNLAPYKSRVEYIPTAAFLTDCYVETIKYLDSPGGPEIANLQSKHISAKKVVGKFNNINFAGNDFEVNGVEAVMLYTVGTKMAAQIGLQGSITFQRNGDNNLTFEVKNTQEIPDQFARYTKRNEERPLISLKDLDSKREGFSQGLFMAELLGYITGGDLTFQIKDGNAVFTIQTPPIS